MAGSYRKALQDTVEHYSGWRPSAEEIDALKGEGLWNNDWDASLEFLRRRGEQPPARIDLISVFSDFYFGGDPNGDPSQWKGLIGNEPLLVDSDFVRGHLRIRQKFESSEGCHECHRTIQEAL